MGKAIIIPDITFGTQFGQVTLIGNIPLRAIQIIGVDTFTGSELQLAARLVPLSATSRGISWSITSGNDYATIDSNGLLTIAIGASSSSVTVRASSTDDNTIYAEKTLTVTYDAPINILEKVSITGAPTLNTGISLTSADESVEMSYKVTSSPGHVGMLWGSLDEHSSAYAEDSTHLVVVFGANADNSPTIGGWRKYNALTTVGNAVVDEFFQHEALRDGVSLTCSGDRSGSEGFVASGDIYILHPTSNYAFGGIDIYYFKINRNGETIHNFKPAEKGGVYGFYDTVTGTFISNTGNGTITA